MSSRAPLWTALVLLAAAAGGVLWFARGSTPSSAPLGAQPAAAAEEEESGAEALELSAPSAEGDGLARRGAAAEGGPAIGVRAAGPGRLAGTVIDRISLSPVAEARVALHGFLPVGAPLLKRLALLESQTEVREAAEPLAVALSDAEGRFAFEGVRAGTWFVEARGEYAVPDAVAHARVSATGDGGPLEVFVRPGGRVVGRVLLPGGEPARGARVVLLPGADHLIEGLRAGDLCVLEAETDDGGGFVFAGVPPGPSYDVFAEGRGFAVSFASGIAVVAGADTEVVLQASPGGSIAGRILSVGDPAHPRAPLAGAHVAAVPQGLRYLPFAAAVLASTHGESDAEGRFVLREVPAGDLNLVAIAKGHAPGLGPSVLVVEREQSRAPDFELATGPSVSGRVVDGGGAPLEGVRVTWSPVGGEMEGPGDNFLAGMIFQSAFPWIDFPLTGADGRFTAGAFAGEAPHAINFSKAGYANVSHAWDPATESELEITLAAGGFVEGIVMDAESAEPVTSFTIASGALAQSEVITAFTGGQLIEDQGGRFRLGPLAAGSVELEVDAPGYAMTHVAGLELEAGATLRGVIVELFGGQRVRGLVVDSDGLPVVGAALTPRYLDALEVPEPEGQAAAGPLQRPARHEQEVPGGLAAFVSQLGLAGPMTVRSGRDGRFELVGVEPGLLCIGAVHRDHATAWSAPIEVREDGGAAEVSIEMPAGGAIFGRVTDRFERPVTGAIVLAVAPNSFESDELHAGDAVGQGRTDEEGRYRIARLAPGVYFLVLTRGDQVLNPMSFLGSLDFDMVTVPEGEEIEYDLVDDSIGGTRVFGHVLAAGVPASGGQVLAMSFESESLLGFDVKFARIADTGAYEFAGLAPGEYQMQIMVPDAGGEARLVLDVPSVPEYQVDLVLPEGRIAGRVLDAESGEPIASAWLSAVSSSAIHPEGLLSSVIGREAGQQSAWSDEEGNFAFERLAEATYEISVRPRNGYVLQQPLEIELDTDENRDDLEIRLEPALGLAGTVSGPGGELLEEASVQAWIDGRPATLVSADTQGDGRFELEGLAPGTYRLRASHPGYAAASIAALDVTAGMDELAIALELGIQVVVEVQGLRGQPVAGAAARLVAAGDADAPADAEAIFAGILEGTGVTDATGRLELGSFAPGAYELYAQRGSARSGPEPVTLDEHSGPVRLTVRLH